MTKKTYHASDGSVMATFDSKKDDFMELDFGDVKIALTTETIADLADWRKRELDWERTKTESREADKKPWGLKLEFKEGGTLWLCKGGGATQDHSQAMRFETKKKANDEKSSLWGSWLGSSKAAKIPKL